MDRARPTQIHVQMSYKQQPRDHPRVRAYLERGWRIADLQRIDDREAIVTLVPGPRVSSQ